MISEHNIQTAITTVLQAHPTADSAMLARGAKQVAALWQEEDGSSADFIELITYNFAATETEKVQLYNRLAYIIEQCNQSADLLNNTLQEPTTLIGKGEPLNVDWRSERAHV